MWSQVGQLYAYHGDVPAEVRLPLQNRHRYDDLRFGRMGWLRQDRSSCAFGCST
jgi:hypothetical protein